MTNFQRGPKAQRLHAMMSAHAHGHDDTCQCRYGRRMDDALREAYVQGWEDAFDAAKAGSGKEPAP